MLESREVLALKVSIRKHRQPKTRTETSKNLGTDSMNLSLTWKGVARKRGLGEHGASLTWRGKGLW